MLATLGRTEFRKRGVVAVLVVITTVTLLSFVAFSADLGYVYNTHSDLQRAVDAGALAGASGVLTSSSHATTRAIEYARYNLVVGKALTPGDLTVTVGSWEWKSRTFYPLTGLETIVPNAIQVEGRRLDMPLFFGSIVGSSTVDVTKRSVGMAGSGRCVGIWGINGITTKGNIYTDSYDPALGPYGGANIRPNGDICGCADISVDGSVEIHGDAMYGTGYNFIPSGNAYEVWGIVGEQSCSSPTPTFDSSDAAIVNDNFGLITDKGNDPFNGTQWDFVVTGNDSLTLPPGTYYFTSALLDGQATITITGQTVIYITGPASFTGGGLLFPNGDAAELTIYAEGPTIEIDGSAGFYGAVVAPNADFFSKGSGEFFGVLIAKTLDFQGSAAIHIDESRVEALFGVDVINPVLVE